MVLLVWQAGWTQNQIITTISPKVKLFPSSGMTYVDDPARYFNIQLINTTGANMDIFFTIELTCDFSVNNTNFFFRTKKEYQPQSPLTIGTTPVLVNRAIFDQMIGGLNSSSYETNYDMGRMAQDLLQLPEGQYRFCLTPYQWDGTNNPNPPQVGETACFTFTICYSGSAPEFTTPIVGLSSGNLNNSNPANNLLTPALQKTQNPAPSNNSKEGAIAKPITGFTSDIREHSQYVVLPLERQLIFNWTGVISNCLMPNDFDYIIKLVEVYANQNIQEAIDQNGTLATVNNKSSTTYIHDTVSNRHFRLQPGHVYAAQVQAVLKKNVGTEILLGNDGKSQIIAFVWGNVPVVQPDNNGSTSSSSSDNHAQVLAQIRNPYFVSPGQDKTSADALKAAISSEAALIPAAGSAPYITDVDPGDVPYYQVDVADSLSVQWMPVRGDSILKVNYTAELYEYIGGNINNSMLGQPIKTATFSKQPPYDFSPSNTELLGVSTTSWNDTLQEGYKYLLHLKAETFYAYQQTTTYTITDYIHGMPSERDSVVYSVAFGSKTMTSDVVFSWGIDSNALDKIYPPQFSYPVDLTSKPWNDTLWSDLPEVGKHDDFKFIWKPTEGANYDDEVYYKLLVAKLPSGKKPEEVKDTLFIKDSITTTSYIDSTLFDSLKTGEQYLAVLWTYIKQNSDSSAHYNMLNDGKSLYATFKLLPPREYKADLSDKVKCYPNALDALSKEIITPKADSLVNNSVRLKMGDFPLVLQKATLNASKKSYSGEGYVVWHPLGIDVRLKVKVDSIQINKDYQIINGTAVSSATDSATYLPALMNDLNLDEWTNDDINRVVSYLGEIDQVKSYYDKFMKYGEKYAKRYGGLLGPLMGGDIATEVLTFPLSVTDKDITGSENVIFSVNNMFFSPVTALMNVWAIFAAQDDDYYIPFLANNICMDYQSLFGKPEQHIDLFMGRSYEKRLNDGYTLRFQASSNFADPKDGTVISIDSGKLQSVRAEIQLDFDPNDLLGLDKDGLPHKGNVVKASLMAEFTSWSDWVAKLYMDPFAVAGADRFTFYPTGKGIFYDHSSKKTPNEVHLTYEYLYGTPPPEDMTPEQRMALTKASNDWEGFYWDEVKVFLSDEISNTFSDEIDEPDSFVVYKYGINNTVVDSVHYNYPGRRINFGAKGMFIDSNGFTCDFFAHDILTASTKEGGGWGFSLDTITISILKNDYKNGHIKGGFTLPLFSGGFRYDCEIGADSLMFGIHATKNPMDLDLWAATVNLDSASTYFRLKKLYKESFTRVDFTLNGKITLNGKKIGLPNDFSLVKFEDMHIRNFKMDGKSPDLQARTASADDFEFDIGEWSFASPQKYIGGYSPEVTVEDAIQDKELGSVSVAGFTFSIKSIDPIINYQGDDIQIGVTVVGGMKFATEGADMGVTTGFSLWGTVHPKNSYSVSDVGGRLDEITLDKIDFEIFTMEGTLKFDYDSATSNDITGFSGSLSVGFMSVVNLTMSAGFGKSKDENNKEYSWWFFDGACKFSPGLALGTVSITGFSGGFAYNMKPKYSLDDDRYSAKGLLTKADGNIDAGTLKSSGMEFEKAKDNWVANAGISLILTGAENTMNADGLVSVRFANSHFSGIFIEANAYVLTNMDKAAVPGDGNNNNNPLIKATTILGFETNKNYDYFRLSIAAKSELDLSNLLDGISETSLTDAIKATHFGEALNTGCNLVDSTLASLVGVAGVGGMASSLTSHDANARAQAEAASHGNGGSGTDALSFSVEIRIPIDFELKHYKKAIEGHNAGETDWYFAIGKPNYEDRVLVRQQMNLAGILKTEAEFTFYLQTGNAFAYQMPPLSQKLQTFFGMDEDEDGHKRKLDTDEDEIARKRRIQSTDWLKIDDGGGFCMGATFHASMEFNFFLYLDIAADLGFDVALLNVGGQGCPGHYPIGKHNFYALGRVYAALQGDVGLKLNLGFWKGKISLFKAGVGALLQGGGPNPSYCYGMLRFQVEMLNGLLKFNTSCDFEVGDVCVPGIGDPLANVKLFQNVTPGFETEASANTSGNRQSPLQVGTIVSNMPWNSEVFLANEDGTHARRFWFTLLDDNCEYATKIITSTSNYWTNTTGTQRLNYKRSRNDANVILFSTQDGGLVPNCKNRLILKARAFEYRQRLSSDEATFANGRGKDVIYDSITGRVVNYNPQDKQWGWYDPTFLNEENGKTEVKTFTKDSTFFFTTTPLPNDMNEQVVLSWPYNGDDWFPCKEYYYRWSENPACVLYMFTRRDDFFDKQTLSANNKQLKIYLLKEGLEDGEIAECEYEYHPDYSLPCVIVTLPKAEYGKSGLHMLKFFLVDKNAYANAEAAAQQANAMTQKEKEYSSRISNETYDQATTAHGSASGRGGRHGTEDGQDQQNESEELNLQNEILDELYAEKQESGKDSMTYERTKLKEGFRISSAVGKELYKWTWNAESFETYESMLKGLGAAYTGLFKNVTVTDNTSYLKIKPIVNNNVTNSGGYALFALMTIPWFMEYTPNDPALYKSNVTLPPNCHFLYTLYTPDKSLGNDIMRWHQKYFNFLVYLDRDFKNTPRALKRHSYQSGETMKYSNDGYDLTTDNAYSNVLSGGLKPGNGEFANVDYRLDRNYWFEQCSKANYKPNSWDVPRILEVQPDYSWCKRTPLDEARFTGNSSSNSSNHTITNIEEYACWYIKDYASVAMSDDIKKIHDFMVANQKHAEALDRRGWSHKKEIIEYYTSSAALNDLFSYTNFPLYMPEVYRVTHFIQALDAVLECMRNTKQYRAINNVDYWFYNRDNDYIHVNKLRSNHSRWAKYWWNAEGQCLRISQQGFDRDFYFRSKDTKYYDVTQNQANAGQHVVSSTLSDVLGEWYSGTTTAAWAMYEIECPLVVYCLTATESDFLSRLGSMAVALSDKYGSTTPNDASKIFFANKIITFDQNTYYSIPLNHGPMKNSLLYQNLNNSNMTSPTR